MNTMFRLAAIGSLLFLGLNVGCGSSAHPTQSSAVSADTLQDGVIVVQGFDRSGSFRPMLGRAVQAGDALTKRLDPDTDTLICYSVDKVTLELFNNPVPDSSGQLIKIVTVKLKSLPTASGTLSAAFWTAVADQTSHQRRPIAICLWSDGDNDGDAHSWVIIRQAAKKLADNPHIVWISIFGVTPENRAALHSAFAPLGDRFHLYGPDEVDTDPMMDALTAAHTRKEGH